MVQAKMPHPHMTKLKYALAGAGVSLAVLFGSKLAGRISKRAEESRAKQVTSKADDNTKRKT